MINPDHAKRVLEHQRETPREIIARYLGMCRYPAPARLMEADQIIELLVQAGYAIEPIEDDDDH